MHGSLNITNARIWTADEARPWASGMVIRDGRVAAMASDGGPDGGPAAARSDGVTEINAGGSVIVPGLIDSHLHLLMGGRSLGEVDLSSVKSRADFERIIARADAQLPLGRWLIGRGWSEQNWGGTMPDRSWLAGIKRPCVCHRMDIHAALVNDAVLELIDARTRPDPLGGRIARDSDGSPTGLLLEAAAWELVHPLIPELETGAQRQCLFAAQRHAHAQGLTAVGSMEFAADISEVYLPLRSSLTLRCAVTLLDRAMGHEPFDFRFACDFDSDDRLSIIGCKTFIDGTLGSRTARMLRDYADDPSNRGMLVELAAAGRLNDWAQAAADAGLSPSMHAIGDEAVRMALDAIDSIPEGQRALAQARIEHAQHIDPADFPRFAGRIASMQPLHKADDGRSMLARIGEERSHWAFPFRSLLDVGAILAFGSDWPVVSCDPVRGMRAAITGLTLNDQPFITEQNVSVEQALIAYTRNAARCLRLERAGVLREGMLGDCVMFDVDPFAADWIRRPPRVIMTIVGGTVVFDATHQPTHEAAHTR